MRFLYQKRFGFFASLKRNARGFTFLELVMTVAILAILSLAAVPLVRNSVKRNKEMQLREALREMRTAIDEFHRDAVMPPGVASAPLPPPVDPRSRVYISETKIFGVDNLDRYPPDLETLTAGVEIKPRTQPLPDSKDGLPGIPKPEDALSKKKVYLRRIPIDPMTGEAEWELRSSYDEKDSTSWGRENVFDVRSKSTETALDGTKYSEW